MTYACKWMAGHACQVIAEGSLHTHCRTYALHPPNATKSATCTRPAPKNTINDHFVLSRKARACFSDIPAVQLKRAESKSNQVWPVEPHIILDETIHSPCQAVGNLHTYERRRLKQTTCEGARWKEEGYLARLKNLNDTVRLKHHLCLMNALVKGQYIEEASRDEITRRMWDKGDANLR